MTVSLHDVMAVLQEIFTDLQDDLGLDDLTLQPETKLIDLGMESISLVYLISELQLHYGQGDAVFRYMRENGQLLTDVSVADVAAAVAAVAESSAVDPQARA